MFLYPLLSPGGSTRPGERALCPPRLGLPAELAPRRDEDGTSGRSASTGGRGHREAGTGTGRRQ